MGLVIAIFCIAIISSLSGEDLCYYYAKRGDYYRAIIDCTKQINSNPNNYVVYSNRGVAYYNKGEYGKAIEDYSKAIEINPKFTDPYNGIAWIYATAKDKRYRNGKKAVEFAKKSLKLKPDYVGAMDTLAASYVENKQPEKAYFTYLKVMEMDCSIIKMYQKVLKKKGYYNGKIDGIISESLKHAIKKCISHGEYVGD